MPGEIDIYTSVVNKLSATGYSRAAELWDEWRQHVVDSWGDEDGFLIDAYFDVNGNPLKEKFIEVLTCDLGMTKEHCYPEDVLDEASEEEFECYDSMDWMEVADAIEQGVLKYVKEQYA